MTSAMLWAGLETPPSSTARQASPMASPWMNRPPLLSSAAFCPRSSGVAGGHSLDPGDWEQRDELESLWDSALFVRNAMSLLQLSKKAATEKGSNKSPTSLSLSSMEKMEGAHSPDPFLDDQTFGNLTDLLFCAQSQLWVEACRVHLVLPHWPLS